MISDHTTLNCRGRLVNLSKPLIMGILNLTPDSFYDGGKWNSLDDALRQTQRMLEEGALFIDIGGMSTRPGARAIGVEEELQRVIPVLTALRERFPEALFSVDTVHARVIREAWDLGIALVNDVSAGSMDPEVFPAIAQLQIPYVLMHMKGAPPDMQAAPEYEKGPVLEILDFFIRQVGILRGLGIKDVILDPGFGFGKTLRDNYRLLQELDVFNMLGLPVLVGVSRKSMIYKALGTGPEGALHGTTALHMVALQKGAKILRVHDVAPARDAIRMWEELEYARQTAMPT
ncbi:MAG: dihydropteroate synthase [Haliscomenobacter sp.]|nr:dihydropteroate synthase [Haliscomenobacter sp.]MBK7474685.1 dihydropteroate synthase [Haliscomenobacter sp.]MBK8877668.1 dihydropteroate synthase [Haliscomenobacter sp.]